MTTIDLEAHFYTKAAFDYLAKQKNYPRLDTLSEHGSYNLCFTDAVILYQNTAFIDKLCDLSESRIKEMDAAGH